MVDDKHCEWERDDRWTRAETTENKNAESEIIHRYLSFLISKDYHPDPYGLSTASEDSEEEKDRFIEISIILKLITDNNGSILWTANKRKIQKARRVTYIARKPEITNMSVYCVVINIPVEPPSCHFA